MKYLKIDKLKLSNFKGITAFELDLDGKDAVISGDNETGKTTLYDAFTWLLFDKDSLNSAQFQIKTIKGGKIQHGLVHSVEGFFSVGDGKKLVLKKEYSEKWTKKRGSVQREFTGHTTDYFIDDVPVGKREYDQTGF